MKFGRRRPSEVGGLGKGALKGARPHDEIPPQAARWNANNAIAGVACLP